MGFFGNFVDRHERVSIFEIDIRKVAEHELGGSHRIEITIADIACAVYDLSFGNAYEEFAISDMVMFLRKGVQIVA